MKFKIPSSFNLGPHTVKIKHVKKCQGCDENTDGLAVYSQNVIELLEDKEYDDTYKLFVFCHEWVHYLLNNSGSRKIASDEGLVDRIASGLQQSIMTMK